MITSECLQTFHRTQTFPFEQAAFSVKVSNAALVNVNTLDLADSVIYLYYVGQVTFDWSSGSFPICWFILQGKVEQFLLPLQMFGQVSSFHLTWDVYFIIKGIPKCLSLSRTPRPSAAIQSLPWTHSNWPLNWNNPLWERALVFVVWEGGEWECWKGYDLMW